MGIFSDKCAYCGNDVRKTARFCNHCGKPAPGGWWKCPSCGKWVGNDSQFCPHCNVPLYPENRPDLAGGVWQKERTRFAERFEAGDVRRLLTDGLQVQEGTVAILLDAGRVSDILGAGSHNPEGVLRKINWFGNPPPRSLVLVDAGEVAVPVSIEGLHTADPFPIEFFGEVIVRFKGDKDSAQRFVGNLLKEGRTFEFADIAEKIQSLVRIGVTDCCTATSLDDLVRDPQRRIRLHQRMTTELSADFEACGLEIVRVSSAEFTGDAYEDYVEKQAEVDIARRRIERDAALRELVNKDEMAKYKDAQDVIAYKQRIDQEFRLEELEKDLELRVRREKGEREIKVLEMAWEEEDIRRRHKLEAEQEALDNERKRLEDEYERQKTVATAEAEAKAAEAEAKAAKIWLEVREIKNEIEDKKKAIAATRRKGMSFEELLADIDDPDLRADLLKSYKMKLQAGMTEKQILATMGIVSNGDAFVAEMQRLYGDATAREDKNLAKMLEPAIVAARHEPNGPNIIK